MAQCQGPFSQMVRLFFGLHIYLAKFCKIFRSTRGSRQCKSGPVNNMVGKRNYLLYHFSVTILLHLDSFYATINVLLKKNQLGKMFIEQILEFELSEPGPPGRTCTPTNGYFHDRTKISKEYLRMIILLFTAKILQEAM